MRELTTRRPVEVSRSRWAGPLIRVMLAATALVLALLTCPGPASGAPRPGPPPSPGTVPPSTAAFSDGVAGSTLKVAVKPLDPFVARTGSTYSGFSVELWNEIARRNDWKTQFVWHDTLPTMLADVQNSRADVGIAAISITKDREQVLDFSYPMFSAGLEVLTSSRAGGSGWTHELSSFVTAGVGRYLVALVGLLVLAGHVVWLATRRRTGRGYLAGVGQGMYKAAGLGLVGDYGVGDPERPIARLVAVIWSILGICFVSLFTAAVTTQLTVQTIQGKIRGVQDLSGSQVVTVKGTTAAAYLNAHSISFTPVETIDLAYARLDAGTADAVVFDAPVLEHHVQVTQSANQIVVGGIFAPEDYGIAFPTGSPLRKKVNTTLLDMRSDGTYDEMYSRYFGPPASR